VATLHIEQESLRQRGYGPDCQENGPGVNCLAVPVRADDIRYIVASDLVTDFNERFSGSGGAAQVGDPVAERVAVGRVREFGDRCGGAPLARAGVGMGYGPQIWLRPGDPMEMGIDGVGDARQHAVGPR
jgi:hypothetical protein